MGAGEDLRQRRGPAIVAEGRANDGRPMERMGAREKLSQGQWVKGAKEEENERHRKFLEYCEERRRELRAKLEEDEERLKEAKRK